MEKYIITYDNGALVYPINTLEAANNYLLGDMESSLVPLKAFIYRINNGEITLIKTIVRE